METFCKNCVHFFNVFSIRNTCGVVDPPKRLSLHHETTDLQARRAAAWNAGPKFTAAVQMMATCNIRYPESPGNYNKCFHNNKSI